MKMIYKTFLILGLFNSLSFSQINWNLDYDSANFAFLVVDYTTYNFEGGYFNKFKYYSEYDRYSIPFNIIYNSPSDYGNILFSYSATNDTIFAADIWWAGSGKIKYPKVIEDAKQFTFDSSIVILPYSIEYLQYMNEISNELYHVKADSAWLSIKKLSILKEFDKMENVFRVGLYLYAPAVGMFRPELAKWIIFLYRGQIITSIDEVNPLPNNYKLSQNYPNPFNPTTSIEYSIAKSENVKLLLYDITGREVSVLINRIQEAGLHKIILDGSAYSSGIYFCKMITSNYIKTIKLILIK